MRNNSWLAILAILVSGCASTQPERVYVDLNRVLATEQPAGPTLPPLPQPKPPAPALLVRQAGLPATTTVDKTMERLKAARDLILENRGKSIASLTAVLKRVYVARANDSIEKMMKEGQPEQDTILAAALGRVRTLFVADAEERGPLLAQLNATAHSIDLADQPIPEGVESFRRTNLERANAIRARIRQMDVRYNAQANALLNDAQKQIQSQIDALEAQARKSKSEAEAKAKAEAEQQATRTQSSLDVQVQRLVPETLPAVPAREVTVPAAKPMSAPPVEKIEPIFGSLQERRRILDQEIEVWIRSSGWSRSSGPKGARDATEEFLQWRSAHKVGP